MSTVLFVVSQSQTGSADFCARSRYDSIYSKVTGKMGNCSVHPVTDRMLTWRNVLCVWFDTFTLEVPIYSFQVQTLKLLTRQGEGL